MFERDLEEELTLRYGDAEDDFLLGLARKPNDLIDRARDLLYTELRKRNLRLTAPEDKREKPAEDGAVEGRATLKVEKQLWYARPGDYADLAPPDCVFPLEEGVAHALRTALTLADIPFDESLPAARADLRSPFLAVLPEDKEKAKLIFEKPVTDEVRQQMQIENDLPNEWELPSCPVCQAPDPLLTSVDPVNTYRCEECDSVWQET